MRKLTIIFVLVVFAINNVLASTAECTVGSTGYTVGYFNGVWNSRYDANNGRLALTKLLPSAYNGKPILSKLFYNHSDCATVGITCLQDLAEVFIQESQALDSTGTLASHFELFWESIGSGNRTFTDKITQGFLKGVPLFSLLDTTIRTKMVAGVAYLLSNPPTASDYAVHNADLDSLGAKGNMLLLVAHSQGNLFVNQAYDHIVPAIGTNSVKVVHVAPPSVTLNGPYLLSNIDLVISLLRTTFGPAAVPDFNLPLQPSAVDRFGHGLVETYLDAARPGRAAVIALLNNQLAALSPQHPACDPSVIPAKTTPPPGAILSTRYVLNGGTGTSTQLFNSPPICWSGLFEDQPGDLSVVGQVVKYYPASVCHDNFAFYIFDTQKQQIGFDLNNFPTIDQANTYCRFSNRRIPSPLYGNHKLYTQGDAPYASMFPLQTASRAYINNLLPKIWTVSFTQYVSGVVPLGDTPAPLIGDCQVAWTQTGDPQKYFANAVIGVPNVVGGVNSLHTLNLFGNSISSGFMTTDSYFSNLLPN